MPRLFTGIKIPAEIGQQLARLQFGLEGARWIDPAVTPTCVLIGDVDAATAGDLQMTMSIDVRHTSASV